MKKKDYPFYVIFVFLLVLIIALLIFIRPITFVAKKRINTDTEYILQTMEINKRIEEYRELNGIYPKSLTQVCLIKQDSLDRIFIYMPGLYDYVLQTTVPVNDTILIISKNGIEKEAYEK